MWDSERANLGLLSPENLLLAARALEFNMARVRLFECQYGEQTKYDETS